MAKFLFIRVARVRTKILGRVGDVYSIFEEKTGRTMQVYKSFSDVLFQEAPKPDYVRFLEPYHIGAVGVRDAKTLPKIRDGVIIDGDSEKSIESFF